MSEPDTPEMIVIREYYRQRGVAPDIVALPALLAFVKWMFERESVPTP